jgi:hypothetical protein
MTEITGHSEWRISADDPSSFAVIVASVRMCPLEKSSRSRKIGRRVLEIGLAADQVLVEALAFEPLVQASRRTFVSMAVGEERPIGFAHASHGIDNGAPVTVVSATLGHADLRPTSVTPTPGPVKSIGRYLKTK